MYFYRPSHTHTPPPPFNPIFKRELLILKTALEGFQVLLLGSVRLLGLQSIPI